MKIITSDQHALFVHELPRFVTDLESAEEDVVIALLGKRKNPSVINGEFDFELDEQEHVTHLVINTEHGMTHLPYQQKIRVDVTCIENITAVDEPTRITAYASGEDFDEFIWEPTHQA